MEKTSAKTDMNYDIDTQTKYWGKGFLYYQSQLAAGRCKKFNGAALVCNIGWLISKQLYKKAFIFTGLYILSCILYRYIHTFHNDNPFMMITAFAVLPLSAAVYIGIHANKWTIQKFKDIYSEKKIDSGLRRFLLCLAVLLICFIGQALIGYAFNQIHSFYIQNIDDSMNVYADSPWLMLGNDEYIFSSDLLNGDYIDDVFVSDKLIRINKMNKNGEIQFHNYDFDYNAGRVRANRLFRYDDYVYHFLEIKDSREEEDQTSKIELYRWDLNLSQYKRILIDGSLYSSSMHQQNGSYLYFTVRKDEDYITKYQVDLSNMNVQSDLIALPFIYKETEIIPIEGSDMHLRRYHGIWTGDAYEKKGIYLYDGEDEVMHFDTSRGFHGVFLAAYELNDHIIMHFEEDLVVYSLSRQQVLKDISVFDRPTANVIQTESGLAIALEAKGSLGFSYISLYTYTADNDGLKQSTINFPLFIVHNLPNLAYEGPRLIEYRDGFKLIFRRDYDYVSVGRLSKDFQVLAY